MYLFAEQIKRLQRTGNVEHEFSIFWVPRRTLVSNSVLEETGIIGDVSIAEFPLYFMPLEQDVLSLELEDSFSDLYLVRSGMQVSGITFILIPAAYRSQLRFSFRKGSHGYPTATWLLPPYYRQG